MIKDLRMGISTLCLFKERFEKLIKRISELNKDLVWEIIDDGLHSLTKERVKRLLDLSREYTVHSPFSDLNTATLNEECRKTYMKIYLNSIKHAYMLSSRIWVLHAGFKSPLGYFFPEREWRSNVSFVKILAEECRDYGLNLLVENLADRALLRNVDEFEKLLNELGWEVIGICLDIGHLNLVVGEKWRGFVDRFYRVIKSVHLHDNRGKFDEHLALGFGSINWNDLLKTLVNKGFKGYLIAENYELRDSLDTLERVQKII